VAFSTVASLSVNLDADHALWLAAGSNLPCAWDYVGQLNGGLRLPRLIFVNSVNTVELNIRPCNLRYLDAVSANNNLPAVWIQERDLLSPSDDNLNKAHHPAARSSQWRSRGWAARAHERR